MTWLDKTRTLLINRPASLTIEQIAQEIDVSAAWLRLFARNKGGEPGIKKTEKLYEFLKNYKTRA